MQILGPAVVIIMVRILSFVSMYSPPFQNMEHTYINIGRANQIPISTENASFVIKQLYSLMSKLYKMCYISSYQWCLFSKEHSVCYDTYFQIIGSGYPSLFHIYIYKYASDGDPGPKMTTHIYWVICAHTRLSHKACGHQSSQSTPAKL